MNKVLRLSVIGVFFPLMYVLLSLSSFSKELFVGNNTDYYISFWGVILMLHWISFFVVKYFLKKEGKSLKDIGYKLNTKKTILLVVLYSLVSFGVLLYTEWTLSNICIDPKKLSSLSNFYPKTLESRVLYIFIVLSAGFCEEIVYRGFLITKFEKLNINKYVSLILAGISFVFIHGIGAISGMMQFGFYFVFALLFGALFLWKRNLFTVILLHLAFDLMGMMAIFQAICD